MADWIPGISQLKSTFQLLCLDPEGALKTQENFVKQCPIVSQVTSVVQAVAGDLDGAAETQKKFVKNMSNVADGVPVVGHVKGAIHYAVGDSDGGARAMRSATRTTAVLGAGAAGMVAGPGGAVAAGMATGVAMDTIYSVAREQPEGYYAAIQNITETKSAGSVFDLALMPVGDGLTGYAGGNIAKAVNNSIGLKKANGLQMQADAMLEIAESNAEAGILPEKIILDQFNKAANLHKQSVAMQAKYGGGGAMPASDVVSGKTIDGGTQTVVKSATVSGATDIISEAGTVVEAASTGQNKKKTESKSESKTDRNNQRSGSAGTSSKSSSHTSTSSTSGGSGQDPNREKLPNINSHNYETDQTKWIQLLKRRLGQLRSTKQAARRGLNANADSSFTANRAIVEAMVEWVNAMDSPEAARDFMIDTLLDLDELINFYQHSTTQHRVVQMYVEFEITTANEKTIKLRFNINVDNAVDGEAAHMGYDIFLNGEKVQVGHVYLPSVPIGRPQLHVFDRRTTVTSKPTVEKDPIKDKKGNRNGKGKWKVTIWKAK